MIIIPNMSKPKNCRECRLRSYEWGNEYISSRHICHALCKAFNGRGFDGGRRINIDEEVHPDCPLIEISDEIWEALKPKIETMSFAEKGWIIDDSNT